MDITEIKLNTVPATISFILKKLPGHIFQITLPIDLINVLLKRSRFLDILKLYSNMKFGGGGSISYGFKKATPKYSFCSETGSTFYL